MATAVSSESLAPFNQQAWLSMLGTSIVASNPELNGREATLVPQHEGQQNEDNKIDGLDAFVNPAADTEHRFSGGIEALERQLQLNASFYDKLEVLDALGIRTPCLEDLTDLQVERLHRLGPRDRILLVPLLSQESRTVLAGLASIAFGGMDKRVPLVSNNQTRAGYLLEHPDEEYTERTGVTLSFGRGDQSERPPGHFNQSAEVTTSVLRYRVRLPGSRTPQFLDRDAYLNFLLDTGRAVGTDGNLWSLHEVGANLYSKTMLSVMQAARTIRDVHQHSRLPVDALLMLELMRHAVRATRQVAPAEQPVPMQNKNTETAPELPKTDMRTFVRLSQEAIFTKHSGIRALLGRFMLQDVICVYWHPSLHNIHLSPLLARERLLERPQKAQRLGKLGVETQFVAPALDGFPIAA